MAGLNEMMGLSSGRSVDCAISYGPATHWHVWRRVVSSVGFFQCQNGACSCFAVCPGCLNSLQVAFQVEQGVPGLVLFWCSDHAGSST